MEEVKVTLHYEDGTWCSDTDDKRFGVVLESGSLDALIEKVKIAIQDIFEVDLKYSGDVKIVFQMAERSDIVKARDVA